MASPTNRFRSQVERLLQGTDIMINGSRPWDLQVHDERFFARVLAQGSLGLGESYMDGWWDCAQLDVLIERIMRHDLGSRIKPTPGLVLDAVLSRVVNRQVGRRAFHIGEAHYDLGNDLYQAMLDQRLTYTCGYWKDATTLDAAQEAKLDLVCRKIGLKAGDSVLDIGCGWGSFAGYAAEKYGARVVGVSVSREQVEFGQQRYKGLDIDLRLQDYRDVREQFDHVVSLGMFEHVGYKNYRTFFEVARRCVKDNGLLLLHTIGGLKSTTNTEPWIDKYIFPNSMLPSAAQIGKAIEGLFVMEDWHNFSAYYEPTLLAWYHNVEKQWPQLAANYNERFHRMWSYYLLTCAASFRVRFNQLWQITLSPNGVPGGYESVR